MNDPLLRVTHPIDPGSQVDPPEPVAAGGESNALPDANEVDTDEREEVVEELTDDVAEAGVRDDAQLFAARLQRIRDYKEEAAQRGAHSEASIAGINAELQEFHVHFFQSVKDGLAAESYSLDALDAHQKLVRQVMIMTNQIQQLTNLELKLRRAPQPDPLLSQRLPQSRPR